MASRLTYVTGNESKFKEACKLLPNLERLNISLPEIQSLDSIEIIKAKLQAATVVVPDIQERFLIVEDGANFFEGCGRLPGPFIKYFIEELGGSDGLFRFAEAFQVKRARVTLTAALREPNGEVFFFTSEVKGDVVAPRGKNRFGFDAIFQPDGHAKTYAEMTLEEKNLISHRAIALKQIREHLENSMGWQF